VGIFEMLGLARILRLPAQQEVVILAVEASDCITVGGAMHPAVRAAVSLVVDLVASLAEQGGRVTGQGSLEDRRAGKSCQQRFTLQGTKS